MLVFSKLHSLFIYRNSIIAANVHTYSLAYLQQHLHKYMQVPSKKNIQLFLYWRYLGENKNGKNHLFPIINKYFQAIYFLQSKISQKYPIKNIKQTTYKECTYLFRSSSVKKCASLKKIRVTYPGNFTVYETLPISNDILLSLFCVYLFFVFQILVFTLP